MCLTSESASSRLSTSMSVAGAEPSLISLIVPTWAHRLNASRTSSSETSCGRFWITIRMVSILPLSRTLPNPSPPCDHARAALHRGEHPADAREHRLLLGRRLDALHALVGEHALEQVDQPLPVLP